MKRPTNMVAALGASVLLLFGAVVPALADGGVTFTDVASAAGITFARTPSPRVADRAAIFASTPFPASQLGSVVSSYAQKPFGAPGVALLDYDGDGDVDIYVANGPGTPNSLYSNQLVETGQLTFVDVAVAAGIDATSQDTTGVCFGDMDNDGDEDVYLTATGMPYQLFYNNGNGTFTDVTTPVTAGHNRHASACTILDVNNDGLLDIVVGNTYDDWNHRKPSNDSGPTYPALEHNYLFVNQGGGNFVDMSNASGLENVSNMNQPGLSGAAFTWAIGSYDYNLDGNTDVLCADNQGAPANTVAELRGWLRLYQNDGHGNFSEKTTTMGLGVQGGWMGLAFGDYNCDGNLDFFATNFGDYIASFRSSFYFYNGTTGFFFGGPNFPTPFGWGTAPFDYDNDGDLDVIYHGSVERLDFIAADNPGVLLLNQGVCSGNFSVDPNIFTNVDHRTRSIHGVATGDLNDDGFADMVAVSAVDWIPDRFFRPFVPAGTPLDLLVPSFQFVMVNVPSRGGVIVLNPALQLLPGSLTVEISDAANGNNWIKVKTRGSVGTLANGVANRDGIGAVVKFTPKNGPAVTRPIVGGASYASQNALEIGFGLGSETKGDLQVLWPGGVRNSLRGVHAGERVLLPEIPCSFDSTTLDYQEYHDCVLTALQGLADEGVLAPEDIQGRYLSSALDAYQENH